MDKDGRLNREEFILAGHLCDLAVKGEPLPSVLPPTLLPVQQRRANSATGASTPASSVGADSFEDRRRENFNKGQQELDRRRQSLIDQQKREEEERKKKEKEEEEERRKKKYDLGFSINDQLVIVFDMKIREEEERQRLIEWEAKRKEQLLAHRQSEEDKLLQLKNKQQTINNDLETLVSTRIY